MKLKILTALITAVTFFATAAYSQTQERVLTILGNLEEATIFFTGAELVHTARVNLNGGESIVEILGLSPVIDRSSVKIKVSDGVIISAFDYKVEQLAAERITAPEVRILRDSMEVVGEQMKKLDIDIRINEQMQAFLRSGVDSNVSATDERIDIADLVSSIDLYRTKAVELEHEAMELAARKVKLQETYTRLTANYNAEVVKWNRREGVIRTTVNAPRSAAVTFTVTYFTGHAGWQPYYDINVRDVNETVEFTMKSKVAQTTGLDWEKVRLTLSTTVPSTGTVAPLFTTWFLEPQTAVAARDRNDMAQNRYSYEPAAKMEESSIVVSGMSTARGEEPIYILNGELVSAQDISSLDPNMIHTMEVLKDAPATSIYGLRGANGVVVITTKTGLEEFITVDDNTTGMVYNIDMLYTVPGNGREQVIELAKTDAPADFKYYSAPRLDPETFLIAEIGEWHTLGLLSARANLTFDGTYLGETFIDAASTNEKLTLTLGTDKRVSVKRERLEDYSSTRTIGSDIQQTLTYQLTVKNNTNQAVEMILKDQYPRSTTKDITVTLLRGESTPWTANNEDVGVVTWEEEFQPGETKIYHISYQVRYPKNIRLNVR
ncbi:MAG: mucoidy inhibitor MuiA family protein [Alistipes sp.]|nr:mucoidy inhibitor MuiA family protein [Alistipes sp.]